MILGNFEDIQLQTRYIPLISFIFFCHHDIAWSLQMADGRIAKERFRDVDVVPLEHIFQTCTFCSSPCTGSTDIVLCNIVQHDFMLGFHDFSHSMLHLFLR